MRLAILLALVLLGGCAESPARSESNATGEIGQGYRLLSATPAEPLLWTMRWVSGYEPGAEAEVVISETLDEIIGAANHSRIQVESVISDPTGGNWSSDDFRRLNGATDDLLGRPLRTLHFYWADGAQLGNRSLAGVNIGNSAVIFPDSFALAQIGNLYIRQPDVFSSSASRVVILHELGHALGLVGASIAALEPRPSPGDADPCNCHSANVHSVMNPGTESLQEFRRTFLGGDGGPRYFDKQDLDDMHTARQVGLSYYGL